jgi:hypothetical protein
VEGEVEWKQRRKERPSRKWKERKSFGKRDRERNREKAAMTMAGAEMAEAIGWERKRALERFKRCVSEKDRREELGGENVKV